MIKNNTYVISKTKKVSFIGSTFYEIGQNSDKKLTLLT